jgi:hypothetical protein
MRPYAGADYNITRTHSRLRSSAFHPQRRRMPTNVSRNTQKMEQPLGKGGARQKGRKGVGIGTGIMPGLTLTSLHSWL